MHMHTHMHTSIHGYMHLHTCKHTHIHHIEQGLRTYITKLKIMYKILPKIMQILSCLSLKP